MSTGLVRVDGYAGEVLPAEAVAPGGGGIMLGGVAGVKAAIESLKLIRTFMAEEMTEGLDYGFIPGTTKKDRNGVETGKKVLMLPGAQKVGMFFNAWPDYTVKPVELGSGHVEYVVTTRLISRATGGILGAGIGSCSTMETKYRFRKAGRVCPECGADAIIKGRAEFGGGWICYGKKGGCGAKFVDGDPAISEADGGRAENENIHDTRNTVLKMAKKRSLVDASIGVGCLAELYTQDLDDTYDLSGGQADAGTPHEQPTPRAQPPRQAPQPGVRSWSGKDLFTWVKDQEQKYEVGLLKYLNSWAKLQGFPARMVEWDGGQVALAHAEASRKLRSLTTHQQADDPPTDTPAPSPSATSAVGMIIDDTVDRWHEFDPVADKADLATRKGRVLNSLVTAAIKDEKFPESAVLKPAEAGKAPSRSRARAWVELERLHGREPEWLAGATRLYLEEKREAAEAAALAKAEPEPALAN